MNGELLLHPHLLETGAVESSLRQMEEPECFVRGTALKEDRRLISEVLSSLKDAGPRMPPLAVAMALELVPRSLSVSPCHQTHVRTAHKAQRTLN
ncbi:hypothetical protein AOLI_G00054550 [Acnodon oligacanthus]